MKQPLPELLDFLQAYTWMSKCENNICKTIHTKYYKLTYYKVINSKIYTFMPPYEIWEIYPGETYYLFNEKFKKMDALTLFFDNRHRI